MKKVILCLLCAGCLALSVGLSIQNDRLKKQRDQLSDMVRIGMDCNPDFVGVVYDYTHEDFSIIDYAELHSWTFCY